MIAIDSSVLIPWIELRDVPEVVRLNGLIQVRQALIPPPTLAEALSGPNLTEEQRSALRELHLLPLMEGFWARAGLLRATVLRAGRRAKFADALIAQVCLDAEVPLLTRDTDFAVFVEIGGLRLA